MKWTHENVYIKVCVPDEKKNRQMDGRREGRFAVEERQEDPTQSLV